MSDDTDGIEIDLVRVHLFAQDLGSHVARGPAGIQGLLTVGGPGYTEVSQSEVS